MSHLSPNAAVRRAMTFGPSAGPIASSGKMYPADEPSVMQVAHGQPWQ